MQTANIPLPFGGGIQWPDTIVVHAMGQFIVDSRGDCGPAGQCYYATEWLRLLKLSAHILVDPSGVLIRCREDTEMAWHAKGHNSNTLGIEVLVPGVHDYGSFVERIQRPYCTDVQLEAAKWQVSKWMQTHRIAEVVRHSDIDPDRKVDPGDGFLWSEFLQEVG